ncbi:MAG: dihydrodipicolinate synthase family protein [Verrucomicrobia bacterium]|nr:dihydrodipicolinate synthase family protein [Verrucomicrobiota bacterium]
MKDLRKTLQEGLVIPALPLALNEDGSWAEKHQRALLRYYVDAGAGGLAVGVHSTQFEIREPEFGLFEPVLRLASETLDEWMGEEGRRFLKIAGICGETKQALEEVEVARTFGYEAALLSLTALKGKSEDEMVLHCKQVAEQMPVIGFYLQPSIGGQVLSYDFWRRFFDIENVVAVKMAPFNRYYTWDAVRALMDSGREDVALYTGNDDSIIVDLLTPFCHEGRTKHIVGGLLGQWGVWTERAVHLLEELKQEREAGETIDSQWLSRNVELTDANAAVFDAANGFAGCIPGIMEVLRRQGLVPSNRCLNPDEVLSPGQAEELDRVSAAYPWLLDGEFVADNLERWLKGE